MKKIPYLMLITALMIASSARLVMSRTSKIHWQSYHSRSLGVGMKIPSAWVLERTKQALAFHSPGTLANRAGVGIMRSGSGGSIKKAADAQMATRGLEGWKRTYLDIGGMRAMKVAGHPKGNPKLKIVRYFITTPAGAYLLQCVAPSETWFLYNDLFDTIIQSIRFS
jgi:hypothetical protein